VGDWQGPLNELRWHYGSAYLISFFEPNNWVAQRRDNRETLTAENPMGLLDLIRADYATNPVPRQVMGDDASGIPSCRLLPGG
jgi:hypothetical protein